MCSKTDIKYRNNCSQLYLLDVRSIKCSFHGDLYKDVSFWKQFYFILLLLLFICLKQQCENKDLSICICSKRYIKKELINGLKELNKETSSVDIAFYGVVVKKGQYIIFFRAMWLECSKEVFSIYNAKNFLTVA